MDRDFLLGDIEGVEDPRSTLLTELVRPSMSRLNEGELGFRIGKYPDERLPKNQRNLSDIRTRVGTLLEYELSRAMQWHIENQSIDQVYASCVVANKYPDLAVRGQNGEMGLRMEVKSIQTVAEEAAANFDTILKDIRRDKDYIILMVWNWEPIPENTSVKHPYVSDFYCFNAYNIALLRDTYWLNTPGSIEGGYQGFDLCKGVTYDGGETGDGYKEEEGNYGKLTRIYNKDFEHEDAIPERVKSMGTLERYLEMKVNIKINSFKDVIKEYILKPKYRYEVLEDGFPFLARIHNEEVNIFIYGAESLRGKTEMEEEINKKVDNVGENCYAIKINPKFNWKPYPVEENLSIGKPIANKQNKPNGIGSFIENRLVAG